MAAVDLAVNPADPSQKVILYGDGSLKGQGGIVINDDYENWRADLLELLGFPSYLGAHFTRVQVTSWAPIGGYVLREFGGGLFEPGAIKEFGNAQPPEALGGSTDPHIYTTRNYGGYNILRAFIMDPAGNGNGYVLSRFGRIYRVGTAPNLTTNNFVSPQGMTIDMAIDWATKKTVLLDQQGRLYMGNGSVYTTSPTDKNLDTYIYYAFPNWEHETYTMFRRLLVVDWTTVATKPKGYALDSFGYLHRFNSLELPILKHIWRDRDVVKAICKVTYPTPFYFQIMTDAGTVYEELSSTPPTVDVVAPGTVTTTTRPLIQWDISDKEFDQEDYTEIHFFEATSGPITIGGDPLTIGGDPITVPASLAFTPGVTVPKEAIILRGTVQHSIQPTNPIPNGPAGVAVRVTEKAAPGRAGLVSAWASESWSQNVPRPGIPTIVATVTNEPPKVVITVTAATGAAENGSVPDVEFTDVASPVESDWQRLRVPNVVRPLYAGAGTFQYRDREIPAGVTRYYRARTMVNDAANYNVSLWSATTTVLNTAIVPKNWWISVAEAKLDESSTLQVAIKVQPGARIEHTEKVTTNLPLDSGYGRGAIVTRTRGKAKVFDLACWVLTEAEYILLVNILEDGRVMCIRDVLGRSTFVQLRASYSESPLVSPGSGGPFVMRHAHDFTLPLVEVRRPAVVDRLAIEP